MAPKRQPFVSVIIAFYNEEQFLQETIQSVLRQSYSNWELLLVDDGSTNLSTKIAKEFAAANASKITYLDHAGHKNRGVCASRNLGVQKAHGELIALLDADDVWLPNKLADQINIYKKYPDVGMIAEGSIYWCDWNGGSKTNTTMFVGAPNDKCYEPTELLKILYPLANGTAPCPSSLLLKRSVVIKNGGFEETFTKQYQLYEDQAFLCKIYLNEKVYISSSCNNLYRQRPDSVVFKVKGKGYYHQVRSFFFYWLETYFVRQEVKDQEVIDLLNERLFQYKSPIICFITSTGPHYLLNIFKRVRKNFQNSLLNHKTNFF